MMILTTRDTSSQIYQDALAIRKKVFVEGQGVPITIEIDDKEDKCLHFVLYQDRQALATCRIFPLTDKIALLQRMAVDENWQGKGLGQELLKKAMTIAKEEGFVEMTLHAQVHAADFYQRLGFSCYGDSYQEAGIAHINMTKTL